LRFRYEEGILKRIHLAPIAGYTDYPFRRVAAKYGWRNRWIPLFPLHPLTLEPLRERYLSQLEKEEREQVLQVFGGKDLERLEEPLSALAELGFSEVNVNAGCPIPKVCKAYGGGYLMKDLEFYARYLSVLVEHFDSLSVKCRLGWDRDTLDEFARITADFGVKKLVIHPRLVQQRFSGRADWRRVFEFKEKHGEFEVLLSGDVEKHSDLEYLLSRVDGVMLGRWAVREPWLLVDSPSPDLKWDFVKEEIRLSREFYGDSVSLRRVRKRLLGYIRNRRGASEVRELVASSSSWEEVLKALEEYLLR